jgi:hypothetical protein
MLKNSSEVLNWTIKSLPDNTACSYKVFSKGFWPQFIVDSNTTTLIVNSFSGNDDKSDETSDFSKGTVDGKSSVAKPSPSNQVTDSNKQVRLYVTMITVKNTTQNAGTAASSRILQSGVNYNVVVKSHADLLKGVTLVMMGLFLIFFP